MRRLSEVILERVTKNIHKEISSFDDVIKDYKKYQHKGYPVYIPSATVTFYGGEQLEIRQDINNETFTLSYKGQKKRLKSSAFEATVKKFEKLGRVKSGYISRIDDEAYETMIKNFSAKDIDTLDTKFKFIDKSWSRGMFDSLGMYVEDILNEKE